MRHPLAQRAPAPAPAPRAPAPWRALDRTWAALYEQRAAAKRGSRAVDEDQVALVGKQWRDIEEGGSILFEIVDVYFDPEWDTVAVQSYDAEIIPTDLRQTPTKFKDMRRGIMSLMRTLRGTVRCSLKGRRHSPASTNNFGTGA